MLTIQVLFDFAADLDFNRLVSNPWKRKAYGCESQSFSFGGAFQVVCNRIKHLVLCNCYAYTH